MLQCVNILFHFCFLAIAKVLTVSWVYLDVNKVQTFFSLSLADLLVGHHREPTCKHTKPLPTIDQCS